MINEIQIEIGNVCRFNCLHCSTIESRDVNNLFWNIDQITELISNHSKDTTIYLTGGEPLINVNLENIIEFLSKQQNVARVGMFTSGVIFNNGLITNVSNEMATRLKGVGLAEVYISIYNDESKGHESITGFEGSLNATLSSIENLKDAGIKVKSHLVLNKHNIDKIDDIIAFCEDVGIEEVRLLKLVNHGNAKMNWTEIGVDNDTQDKVINSIVRKKENFNIRITCSGFPNLAPCRPLEGSVGCEAGTSLLYIDYFGDVYPCACVNKKEDFKIGNIVEQESVISYLKNCKLDSRDFCLNR